MAVRTEGGPNILLCKDPHDFFGKERKMAKSKITYSKLIKLAKEYGVADNALFMAAAEQYAVQSIVIQNIKDALDDEDELTTTKEYVKGRQNLCVNPLIKELPKHSDSANKTLQTMLDIITKLGHEPAKKNRLAEMMSK